MRESYLLQYRSRIIYVSCSIIQLISKQTMEMKVRKKRNIRTDNLQDKLLSPVQLCWNAGENCSDYSLMTDLCIRTKIAATS